MGGITREEGAEVDHGVGEGRGVEDLPGIDLVGPELVGGLHPRRRRRLLKRGGGGARVAAGGEGSEEAERLRLCLCLSGEESKARTEHSYGLRSKVGLDL